MNRLALVNDRVMTPHQTQEEATVSVEGERIVAIRSGHDSPQEATIIDTSGCVIAPGFIAVHVHGGAGYDTMDATPQALRRMAGFSAAHGVTSFLPIMVAAGHPALLAAFLIAAKCQRNYQGEARILEVHLEGFYFSPAHPGAQPFKHIRLADLSEYSQLFAFGNVLLISLVPEIPGTPALIEHAVAWGAAVAVGHSAATYDEVMAGVKLGLRLACHTFNGMTGLHHRQAGTVGAMLACDEIYAQVIVDRVEMHQVVVKLLVRVKGRERIVLITDAMRAVGLPEGEYELADLSVTVSHKVARLIREDSLAGSVLTMDQALRNVMEATGLSLTEALPMATSIPAHSLGLGHELGSILPGYIAGLVILDQNVNVQATLV